MGLDLDEFDVASRDHSPYERAGGLSDDGGCEDLAEMFTDERDRKVLMWWCQGATQDEIGIRLGTNRTDAHRAIKSIRQRLKHLFEIDWPGEDE